MSSPGAPAGGASRVPRRPPAGGCASDEAPRRDAAPLGVAAAPGFEASLPKTSKCVAMRPLNSVKKAVTSGSPSYFFLASSGSDCMRLIASMTRGFDKPFIKSGRLWSACSSWGVTQLLSSLSLLAPWRNACWTSGNLRLSLRASAGFEGALTYVTSSCGGDGSAAAAFRVLALPELLARKPFLSPPPLPRSAFFLASSVSRCFCLRNAKAFSMSDSAASLPV
mmetsp:Transcript_49917/g.139753  ORF Transcript_49917/g.139753 Transcript_49917/m.139753 type:complete len:223 (+) Transcript_49917:255-923(+)